MGGCNTKVKVKLVSMATKLSSIRVTGNPVIIDHKRAKLSFIAGIFYWLGGDKYRSRLQFEMWRYLRSRRE